MMGMICGLLQLWIWRMIWQWKRKGLSVQNVGLSDHEKEMRGIELKPKTVVNVGI